MKLRIIVPYDFSETADAALAWAADLRATTGGPPLTIIHAVSARTLGTPEMPVAPILPDELETRRLEQSMRDAAARHHAEADARVVVGVSEIWRLVIETAAELRADLIVMGTHGLTGVRRLLLGSTAEQVVRQASCPVVTVRSAHAQRA
jgi:nucleotide-binding universal stress UspA family protein